MSDIGFNDNLEISGRMFHVQTASSSTKGNIRCELFENGRVLSASQIEFERRNRTQKHSVDERLKSVVESLHQEMISEIELLFTIGEKVKKLGHAPSSSKIGLIFLQNNLIEDAITHFKLAIKNDKKFLEAYNNLGLTYLQIGDPRRASQVYATAVQIGSGFTDLHNNYGLSLLMEGKYKAALGEVQNALKLNKNFREAHYNLALLYLRSILTDKTGEVLPPPSIRKQRSLEHMAEVKKSRIKVFDNIYDRLIKHVTSDEIEAAVILLEEFRKKVFPRDLSSMISTNFYLKFMYGGKGLDNDTIIRYEERLRSTAEDNPDYADIWNNLGVVHLIQCRNLFLQALGEFRKALEINPDFEKAKKNKILVENDGKEFLILLRAILK
ncbi:MAG: tetratricopeptide repeat protein [Calditrichales bacterium]|nr:MAG: tetratricopeptide repeat protein [Calditrichales bacterium]